MKTYNGETLVLSRNRRILILYSFHLAHYFVIGLQKVKNPGAEGQAFGVRTNFIRGRLFCMESLRFFNPER